MKNKLFLAGMLAMALAFGFVVMGCGNPLEDGGSVTANPPKAPGVDKVDVVVAAGSATIAWEAAENATSYTVYIQPESKKTIFQLSTVNTPLTSADFDLWGTSISLTGYPAGKYRFGVAATNPGYELKSEIVWSDYIAK